MSTAICHAGNRALLDAGEFVEVTSKPASEIKPKQDTPGFEKMTTLANILDSPAIIGGVAGGLATLLFFVICYAKKVQFGKGKRMGLNFEQTSCPNCGHELPRIRKPANLRQMLWGGWTCSSCGGEFDKWMQPIGNDKAQDS